MITELASISSVPTMQDPVRCPLNANHLAINSANSGQWTERISRVLDHSGEEGLDESVLFGENYEDLYMHTHTHILKLFEPVWKIQLKAIIKDMDKAKSSVSATVSFLLRPFERLRTASEEIARAAASTFKY